MLSFCRVANDELNLMKCPVFLPITPTLALFAHPFDLEQPKIVEMNKMTGDFVKLTMGFSNEFIYSNLKETRISELFDLIEKFEDRLNYQYRIS